MSSSFEQALTRRRVAVTLATLPALAVATGPFGVAFAQKGNLSPTPACDVGVRPTLAQTAGPYFKPRSPQRTTLIEPGMAGERLTIEGFVLTAACRPVERALIDLWQADPQGHYDNSGFRLRGHLFTGPDGRYRVETIVPAAYIGRTRHIHVKVQAPNGPVLTTQLYFPGEPGNQRDTIFRRELVMQMTGGEGGRTGRFDFVVATA
jgi:protocatechuate 3,4-dioxygenase beta subunit